jgi:hypothetical protein
MAASDPEKPFNNFYTPENSAFYSASIYQPLDPGTGDFRVLEILPGSSDDVVKCNLIKSFEGIEYEALSYRAGDPADTKEILVHGHPFNAFATLFGALIALRGPSESRIVWIDQICINQNDVAERNHQVQKMRDVYHNAQRVVAWLGPLGDDGKLAIDAVQSIYEDYLGRKNAFQTSLVPYREIRELEREGALLEGLADDYQKQFALADHTENKQDIAKVKALGRLVNSEFWIRVWIWQELIVARGIQLLWDIDSMGLEPFYITSTIIAFGCSPSTSETISTDYLVFPNGVHSNIYTMLVILRRRSLWKMDNPLNFRSILRKTHAARASDPRDKIFALSGLIHPKHNIVPNYTETVSSVYCSTCWSIIAAERSLDILVDCLHPRGPNEISLPSWCPDWSREPEAQRVYLLLPEAQDLRFNACKSLGGSFRIDVGKDDNTGIVSSVLFVEGLAVSSVQELGRLQPYSNIKSKEIDEVFRQLLNDWRSLINKKRPITEQLKVELERTAMVDGRGLYDTTEISTIIDSREYQTLKYDAVSGDRRFFITEEGLMGMAPPHVLPGDIICVFQGTRVPLLLRQEGTFYTLVGEVYVSDGYMKGRAFDEMEQGKWALQEFELH